MTRQIPRDNIPVLESALKWILRPGYQKQSRSRWVIGITFNSWITSSCPSNADTAMSMATSKETIPKISKGTKQKDGKEPKKGKQLRKIKRKGQDPGCKPQAVRRQPQKEGSHHPIPLSRLTQSNPRQLKEQTKKKEMLSDRFW